MKRPDPGADDTIIIRPAVAAAAGRRPRQRWPLVLAGSGALAVLVAAGMAVWWPGPASPPPAAVQPAPPHPAMAIAPPARPVPPAAAPEFVVQTATQVEILNHVGKGLTIFRFAPDPRILVLDFASLFQQGMMLDRVAALMEKAGEPHNRILTDAQLDAAIHAGGDTIGTYYYGHDYSVQELVRFFALASAEHMPLHPQEQMLRQLMQQLGWFKPGVHAALISIPQVGANAAVTMEARSVILQHELSHGLYFSDPAYAAYVQHFWHNSLTPEERTAFMRFLGSEEYDTSLTDLMMNECQAYLMFTRDPAFFRPSLIGMTQQRLTELRTEFAAGMPDGWLRNTLLALNAAQPVSAAAHPPSVAAAGHGPD